MSCSAAVFVVGLTVTVNSFVAVWPRTVTAAVSVTVLAASPLAGWLTVPSVAMTLLSEDAHVTPFAVGSEMNGSSTVVGMMMPFSTEPVSSPA